MASTQSADFESNNSEYFSRADGDLTGLKITGDISFEFWIKFESVGTMGIVDRFFGTGNESWGIHTTSSGGNIDKFRLKLHDSSGTSENFDLSTTIGTGTWTHVAITWDASTSSATLYTDGSQDATASGSITDIDSGNKDLSVGRLGNDSAYFDGQLFDARIWSEERTGTEVSDNKDCHVASDSTNLQANWIFDGDGLDATSNNNDLTNNNTVTFASDIPSSHSGDSCGITFPKLNTGSKMHKISY